MVDLSVHAGRDRRPRHANSLVLATALLASVVILIVGIALGFASVHSYGIPCSSVFGGVSDNALTAPEFTSALTGDTAARAMQANCETAVARRRPEVSTVVLTGATLVVGSTIALGWNLSRRRARHGTV